MRRSVRRGAAAALATAALAGCAKPAHQSERTERAERAEHVDKETAMTASTDPATTTIEVATSDELNAVYARYLALVEADRPARLEIVLAPGTYGKASIGPISLLLEPSGPVTDPTIDVVVRARDRGGAPVVLDDMDVAIQGRSVVLDGLVLARRASPSVLKIVAAGAIRIARCRFVAGALDSPHGGALIAITGTGDHGPQTLDIEDSWFVRNRGASPGSLLSAVPSATSYFERVAFRGAGFVDNQLFTGVRLERAKHVELTGCFVYQRPYEGRPGGSGTTPSFLRTDVPPESFAIERSILVLDRRDHLAVQELGEARPPTLARTAVYEVDAVADHAAGITAAVDALAAGAPPRDGVAGLAAAFGITPP
jgi:hypothetical protein